MDSVTPTGGRHERSKAQRDQSRGKKALRFLSRFTVFVVAGLMFAMSATLRPSEGSRYDSDLLTLVSRKESSVSSLRDQNDELRGEIDDLVESVPGRPNIPAVDRGRADLKGPGIVVTLNDAPVPEPFPDGVTADDLVIHQQDIEAVFNALWQGGAEVVGVQGHQVQANSTVSCVGNVINIDGNLYSPPYEIAAIGPANDLRAALFSDPQIEIIQGYVARYGLGFKVSDDSEIMVQAAVQKPEFSFAKVKGD